MFAIILLISFVILTSITTTTIRAYVTEDKENALVSTGIAISNHLQSLKVEDVETFANSGLGTMVITPIVSSNTDMIILITNENGKVLLTTARYKEVDGLRVPVTNYDEGNLGTMSFDGFSEESAESGILSYKQ